MVEWHRLLQRQLRHHFKEDYQVTEDCKAFFQAVNEAYLEFDSDRRMLERSLDLSSQELMQVNAETRATLKQFPDAFLWLEPNGKILVYKSGIEVGQDVLQDIFAAGHIQNIQVPELKDRILHSIQEATQSLIPANMEFSVILNNAVKYFEARIMPPAANRILVIIRDITRQKEVELALKESESKYRTVFESANDVLLILDPEGYFLDSNNKIKDLTGYGRESIIGKHLKELTSVFTLESIDLLTKNLAKRIKGERIAPYEINVVKIDGSVAILELNAVIMRKGESVIGDLVVLRDITARKQTEQRIRDLYEQEKKQRLELEEEAKARSQFINVIAHELRTPLTPLLISIDMIRDALSSDPDSVTFKMVENALRSTESLKNRLEELLDLARLSRGVFTLKLHPVETSEFLEAVVLRYMPAMLKKQQRLLMDIPPDLPVIVADPSCLEQVIVNLLSNASKYSPDDTEIIFKSYIADNNLQVEIKDNGIGISLEDQKSLFMPYHRVEQDRQTYPGIGLGLAVCKQIIEAHKGRIWVESEKNKGCIFKFMIPLSNNIIQNESSSQ